MALRTLLLALLLAPLPAAAEAAEMPVRFGAVLALPAPEPQRRIDYGGAPSQHASLWLPAGDSPAPVVVLLHGGCWLSDYSAPHVYPLAARLARDGFAVWVPEYRRVGEEGGGWPGTFDDARAAVRRLGAFIATGADAEPAVASMDGDRVLLMGHSAGGHLALWLAAQPDHGALGIRGVVGLAAISDLYAYAGGTNNCEQVTVKLMGGSPSEQPRRYATASPAALPLRLPTHLLRGAMDDIVGAEQLAAVAPSPLLRRDTLDGAGHFDWIHPQTAAYPVVVAALREMLNEAAP